MVDFFLLTQISVENGGVVVSNESDLEWISENLLLVSIQDGTRESSRAANVDEFDEELSRMSQVSFPFTFFPLTFFSY